MSSSDPLLSVRDVAALLPGTMPRTVQNWITKGVSDGRGGRKFLKAHRIGSLYVIRASDLNAFAGFELAGHSPPSD